MSRTANSEPRCQRQQCCSLPKQTDSCPPPASLNVLADLQGQAVQLKHSHANLLGPVFNDSSIAVGRERGCCFCAGAVVLLLPVLLAATATVGGFHLRRVASRNAQAMQRDLEADGAMI